MSNRHDDMTIYVEKTSPEQHQKKPPSGIEGWGADLDPQVRPAYPMERTPPRFINRHWDELEHQPPSGVSGKLRDFAFGYSENDLRHWLMLLFADRVNVVEGILQDLAHGHVPNVFKEMGGPAEWKYNRAGFYKKAAIAGGVVALLLMMNARRSRRR
jgi:hypothetical protein